jgi:hypothetical protein
MTITSIMRVDDIGRNLNSSMNSMGTEIKLVDSFISNIKSNKSGV